MAHDMLSTPEEFKALAHPLRQRMLFLLGERPATISQLAVTLDTRKGNVSHHIKVLRASGLVEPAESRQVRGGTEQYFRRSARRIEIADAQPGPAAAMLGALAKEFSEAPGDPLLALRHLRLTAEQADRLHDTLLTLVSETEEADDDQQRYGLLVGFYQQPSISGIVSDD